MSANDNLRETRKREHGTKIALRFRTVNRTRFKRSVLATVSLLLPVFSGCGAEEGGGEEHVGSSGEALTAVCGQPSNGPVQGYDISEFQPNFNWNNAKNNGVAFGYARISYGASHVDATFDANWKNIKAAGLLRGAYQYFLPNDDIAKQAQMVIDKVGKLGPDDLPVQFDMEPTSAEQGGLSRAQLAAKMHQWLDLVEAGTGKRPIIYTNAYGWQDRYGSSGFEKYDLWISNYNPSQCPLLNDGWKTWRIWQYSDGNGTLDHDVFNGTLADLKAWANASTGSTDAGGPDDGPSDDYPMLPKRSAADLDGDGQADVCVRAIRGLTCALSKGSSFSAEFDGPAWKDADGWDNLTYRSTIQFGDVDGDGKADVCARGRTGMRCALSQGQAFSQNEINGPAWSDDAGWNQPSLYGTIQLADVNGDGKLDVCGRSTTGLVCNLAGENGFPNAVQGPAWSDDKGWSRADRYATIQFADVNGDRKADVCAKDAAGIVCHLSTGNGFSAEVRGPAWSNDKGWNKVQYGSTIRFADVDGDGRADVCGRGPDGIVCARSTGQGFGAEIRGPAWSDAKGWSDASSYRTIQWGDLDGDKRADVCGRSSNGIVCSLSTGEGFSSEIQTTLFADTSGGNQAKTFTTLAMGDVNHDGKDDLCGRDSSQGFVCATSNGKGFGAPFLAAGWSDAAGFSLPQYYETVRVTGLAPTATFTGTVVDPGTAGDAGAGEPGGTDSTNVAQGPRPVSSNGGCAVRPTGVAPHDAAYAAGITVALGLVLRRRRRKM